MKRLVFLAIHFDGSVKFMLCNKLFSLFLINSTSEVQVPNLNEY